MKWYIRCSVVWHDYFVAYFACHEMVGLAMVWVISTLSWSLWRCYCGWKAPILLLGITWIITKIVALKLLRDNWTRSGALVLQKKIVGNDVMYAMSSILLMFQGVARLWDAPTCRRFGLAWTGCSDSGGAASVGDANAAPLKPSPVSFAYCSPELCLRLMPIVPVFLRSMLKRKVSR